MLTNTDIDDWADSSTARAVGRTGEPALIMPKYRTASPGLPKLHAIQSSHQGQNKQGKKKKKKTAQRFHILKAPGEWIIKYDFLHMAQQCWINVL